MFHAIPYFCGFVILLMVTTTSYALECKKSTLQFYYLPTKDYQTCTIKRLAINQPNATFPSVNLADSFTILVIRDAAVEYFPNGINAKFSNLVAIETTYCSIKSITRNNFDGLNRLLVLNLGFNKIGKIEQDTFAELTALEYLALSKNKLAYIKEGTFNGLLNLKKLYLSNNEIFFIEAKALSPLINMEFLSVSNNSLGTISGEFLSHNSKLKNIYLNNNNISFIETSAFELLKSIEKVDLEKNICIDKKFTPYSNQVFKQEIGEKCNHPLGNFGFWLELHEQKTKAFNSINVNDINNLNDFSILIKSQCDEKSLKLKKELTDNIKLSISEHEKKSKKSSDMKIVNIENLCKRLEKEKNLQKTQINELKIKTDKQAENITKLKSDVKKLETQIEMIQRLVVRGNAH